MDDNSLIVIGGPTASGKSSLGIELSRIIGGEIISADSMQIYKEMDIGTAKVTPDEMKGIHHYLIDQLEPDEDYNAAIFKEMAVNAVKEIRGAGHVPVVVGGTGFYIQALLRDIHFTETDTDCALRTRLQNESQDPEGSRRLYERLIEIDPDSAQEIHPNNIKRIIRALEFYYQTGIRMSAHNREEAARKSPYNYAYFVLNMPRPLLYEKIERRVDIMMEKGLLDEVRSLKDKGYTRDMVSMQGLGYKELFPVLDGECSLEEAVNILKRDTRRFAKRQLTWFRREKDTVWLDWDKFSSMEEMLDTMIDILKYKQII